MPNLKENQNQGLKIVLDQLWILELHLELAIQFPALVMSSWNQWGNFTLSSSIPLNQQFNLIYFLPFYEMVYENQIFGSKKYIITVIVLILDSLINEFRNSIPSQVLQNLVNLVKPLSTQWSFQLILVLTIYSLDHKMVF